MNNWTCLYLSPKKTTKHFPTHIGQTQNEEHFSLPIVMQTCFEEYCSYVGWLYLDPRSPLIFGIHSHYFGTFGNFCAVDQGQGVKIPWILLILLCVAHSSSSQHEHPWVGSEAVKKSQQSKKLSSSAAGHKERRTITGGIARRMGHINSLQGGGAPSVAERTPL